MQKAIEGAILPLLVFSGFSLNTLDQPPYRIIKRVVTGRVVATHPAVFVAFETLRQ